jgi:hypothetical protein
MIYGAPAPPDLAAEGISPGQRLRANGEPLTSLPAVVPTPVLRTQQPALSVNGAAAAAPFAAVQNLRRISCGFEPVSADAQPVSGRLPIQISDVDKSSSRDSRRKSRP